MNDENTKIYVRVAGSRPKDFNTPKPFVWDGRRDRILWTKLSKIESLESMNWKEVSSDLGAPEYFLKKRSYVLFHDQLKVLSEEIEKQSESQGVSRSNSESYKNDLSKEPKKQLIHDDVVNNLHSSRIMNHKIEVTEQGDNDISSSEFSNLSISKSALEEALIDRLHL